MKNAIKFLFAIVVVMVFNVAYTQSILFSQNSHVIDIDDDIGELKDQDIYVTRPVFISRKSCKNIENKDYLLVGNSQWGIRYDDLVSLAEYNSHVKNAKPFMDVELESCDDLPILMCRYITLPEKKYHSKNCMLFVPIYLKIENKVFRIGITLSGKLFSPDKDNFFSPLSEDREYLQIMLAFREVTIFALSEKDKGYKFETYLKEGFTYSPISPR